MSRPSRPVPLLDEEHAAFIQTGVSITLASRDAQMRPWAGRAAGCCVSRDRRRVTLYVSPTQYAKLCEAITATGTLAAVFSAPVSHRTLQLKSSDVRFRPLRPADRLVMARYLESFTDELEPYGYTPGLTRAVVAPDSGDFVALEFTPEAAFNQTPGPQAGEPLAAAES